MRPCNSGDADNWSIALRDTPLIMSAAPATARHRHEITMPSTAPKNAMATPHTTIDETTTNPCRVTLRVHPENMVAVNMPNGIDATINP